MPKVKSQYSADITSFLSVQQKLAMFLIRLLHNILGKLVCLNFLNNFAINVLCNHHHLIIRLINLKGRCYLVLNRAFLTSFFNVLWLALLWAISFFKLRFISSLTLGYTRTCFTWWNQTLNFTKIICYRCIAIRFIKNICISFSSVFSGNASSYYMFFKIFCGFTFVHSLYNSIVTCIVTFIGRTICCMRRYYMCFA